MRFDRGRGAPQRDVRDIAVPFSGMFCVVLQNGEAPPPHGSRVSSAVIELDDRQVFGPADFSQDVAGRRAAVRLERGRRTLAVELRSAPGSFLKLTILGLPDPGIPFEVVPTSGRRAIVGVVGEPVEVGFAVQDALGTRMPGVEVALSVVSKPVESRGSFLMDKAIRAVAQSSTADPGSLIGTPLPELRLATNAEGTNSFLFEFLDKGTYVVEASIVGQDWLPGWRFCIDPVLPAGEWVNHTAGLALSPSRRFWPAMTFDTNRSRVLLFGGCGSVCRNDLWALPLPEDITAPMTGWTQIAASGEPPALGGASVAYVRARDAVFLFTGRPWAGGSHELEIWEFAFDDPAGNTGTWRRLSPDIGVDDELSPIPARLFGQLVHDVGRHRLIFLGGWAEPAGRVWSSDVVFFDYYSPEGTLVGRTAPPEVPPRANFGAVLDRLGNRVVVYGGITSAFSTLSDVWELDLALEPYGSWRQLTQSSDPAYGFPPQVHDVAFAMDDHRGRAILFGGSVGSWLWTPTTDQVWAAQLDVAGTVQWSRLFPVVGPSGGPTPRAGHGVAGSFHPDNARMIAFGGGGDDGGSTAETWELRWSSTPPPPTLPRLLFAQCAPAVIFNDGSDTTRCVARWDDRLGVTSVSARLPPGAAVPGYPGPDVPLRDDGLGGDDAPDGTWTLADISYTGPERPSLHPSRIGLYLTATGTAGTYSITAGVGVVAPETVPTSPAPTDPTNPNVRLSGHVLFLSDASREYYPDYVVVPGADLEAGFKRAYARATDYLDPDRFELGAILLARDVFLPEEEGAGAVPASHGVVVRAAARHIGLFEHDSSYEYCCNLADPAPCSRCNSLLGLAVVYWYGSGMTLIHEIGHTWGVVFGWGATPPIAFGAHWTSDYSPPSVRPYMVDIESVMSSDMSIWRLVSEEPCQWTFGGAKVYDEFDQYLMGLIPSSMLPVDLRLYYDPDPMPRLDMPGGCSHVERMTTASVVALQGGERDPDWLGAPRSYDLSIVVVSPDPFTPAEVVYFDRLARWIASTEGPVDVDFFPAVPFWEATSRRGTLSTDL